jgi:hypothetical protein
VNPLGDLHDCGFHKLVSLACRIEPAGVYRPARHGMAAPVGGGSNPARLVHAVADEPAECEVQYRRKDSAANHPVSPSQTNSSHCDGEQEQGRRFWD